MFLFHHLITYATTEQNILDMESFGHRTLYTQEFLVTEQLGGEHSTAFQPNQLKNKNCYLNEMFRDQNLLREKSLKVL